MLLGSRLGKIHLLVGLSLLGSSLLPAAAEGTGEAGQAILERNCGRCHGVVVGQFSPLKEAPNLVTVLSAYPWDRLEVELSEGIGSRHKDMPQIQFSIEDITSIYLYVRGQAPDTESRQPQ